MDHIFPSLHASALPEHKLTVKFVQPLYSYPLKNYLHERSIPVSVADAFCEEVSYEVGGYLYYGIGFQNDAGGWEIRNKNFKQSSSPKDITCLGSGAGSCHVFEGFIDFLSYRSLHPYEDPRSVDYVVTRAHKPQACGSGKHCVSLPKKRAGADGKF